MTNVNPRFKDYPRFLISGYPSDGECFLRACSRAGGLVILCSQVFNHNGVSITNYIETIFVDAIKKLRQDMGIDHLLSEKRRCQFKGNPLDAARQIAQHTIWVEHYTIESESNSDELFALVEFNSALRPTWRYMSKDRIISACNIGPDFLMLKKSSELPIS